LLVVAALGVIGLGVSAAKAQNVLANPGFESPDASAGDQPGSTSWNAFNSAFTTRSVTPHSGLQTLKVFGPFFVGGGAGVTQGGFAAAPGQGWTASAFLRDDSSDPMQGSNFAQVQLQFLNSANSVLTTISSPNFTIANPINTWVPETASGIAPAGTTSAQIVLVHVQLNSPVTGGSVFFDDASLSVPEPASLGLLALGVPMLLRRRSRA
jgi:hypothetical protein